MSPDIARCLSGVKTPQGENQQRRQSMVPHSLPPSCIYLDLDLIYFIFQPHVILLEQEISFPLMFDFDIPLDSVFDLPTDVSALD